jgi:putative transposase
MCESRRRLKTSTLREGLAVRVQRKLRFVGVIDTFSDLFIPRGVPERSRSGTGPEFLAKAVQNWIAAVGATAADIARGSA